MFFYHNFYLFFLLLAVSFRHGFFLPAFLFKNTYRVFSDFNSRFYTHFSLLYMPISFRFVFFCLLFSSKTHTVCFLTSILAFIHTFPFSTCQSASGLCFSACFSFKRHMPCVFRLQFSLLYTLFPSLHANQLPVCVFLLAFLSKTHAVCFPTSILAFIHTFLFSTCLLASGLCFSACFLNMCFKHIFFPLSSYS